MHSAKPHWVLCAVKNHTGFYEQCKTTLGFMYNANYTMFYVQKNHYV